MSCANALVSRLLWVTCCRMRPRERSPHALGLLLRASRERAHCRATEQPKELPSPHKMTPFRRHLSTVTDKGRPYQIRSLLRDHDRGGVDIRRGDGGHHRSIRNTQAFDAANA